MSGGMFGPNAPFSINSSGGAVSNGTNQTITGIKTWLAPAIGAGAEIIAKWGVSDDAADLMIAYNTNTADNAFNAGLQGYSQFPAKPAFTLSADVATGDSGTQPAMMFQAENGVSVIATRPLFGWYNYTTRQMTLYANGLLENVGTIRATSNTSPAAGKGIGLDLNGSIGRLVAYDYTALGSLAMQIVASSISASGLFDNAASIRTTGLTAPASGVGGEFYWDGTTANLISISRNGAGYQPLKFQASTITAAPGGSITLTMTSTLTAHSVPEQLASYTVATLPAASIGAGALAYASNAAGNGPCIAMSNGTVWKRCDNTATTVA